MDELVAWKTKNKRKPLIIRGARQVGKTWLMKEFGRLHFDNVAYINFDSNKRMETLFNEDYDIKRLIDGLEVETGEKILPNSTLIIFDEVQEVKKALSSLKYFYENAPEYAIIAGGSLLGIAMGSGISYPVGKVDNVELFPLCFCEFLEAKGEEKLAEMLQKKDWEMVKVFKTKFIDYLRKYYYVGGMPEIVETYVEGGGYDEVRALQNKILFDYDQDFGKHVPDDIIPKVKNVWASVPAQLAREKKKFSSGIVKEKSRLNDYEKAIQWLIDAGLVYKIGQITKPSLPLSSYDTNFFKIYIHDVGLLGAKSDLDVKTILDGEKIFEEFKGSLTEQYVLQELKAKGINLFYWASEARAEVDFVFKVNGVVYPLEVKAEENLQSKSLKTYAEKYKPELCLRASMKDFRNDGWLENIPLYAIGNYFNE
jgi:predicted AAA+ superfamily ATPase